MNWIALLGKRDSPTDGVADYCQFLAEALVRRGQTLEIVRVDWAENGWLSALRCLSSESKAWRGKWVLLQYTALNWSRRGFPFGAYAALRTMCHHGARCAVVFHDPSTYSGNRLEERIRRACQSRVMRSLYEMAERSIFTEPVDQITWLPANRRKAAFIPIGANIPAANGTSSAKGTRGEARKTVAVFGVTGGGHGPVEVADIAYAVACAQRQVGALRLTVLGRGSTESADSFIRALVGSGVELAVLGVLPAEEVSRTLTDADAFLSVRALVTPRRGSVLAGVACGLPVIGYGHPDACYPISEAGLALVPWHDRDALAASLGHVLGDDAYRQQLRQRSRLAYAEHFNWERIAESYLKVLGND